MTVTKVLDDSCLHSELDPVERNEPDDVPNPDDTNPATRDSLDVGEAPVTVGSNDRRDELSDAEGTHESNRGALHEEPTVRTGDEDEGLRDDGNLEVDDGVELVIVVVEGLVGVVLEGDTELAPEEVCANADGDESDAAK